MFQVDLIKSVVQFWNMQFQFPKPWLTSTTSKCVLIECLQTAKSLINFCRRIVKLFCSNYWQNPLVADAVHYFHENSHHHYDFYYYCKKHLYRPKIYPVSAKFCLLFPGIYVYLAFQAFRFVHPVKGLRIRLQPPDIFQMFSLYLCLNLQLFTQKQSFEHNLQNECS